MYCEKWQSVKSILTTFLSGMTSVLFNFNDKPLSVLDGGWWKVKQAEELT
jgi:hypothetical protein